MPTDAPSKVNIPKTVYCDSCKQDAPYYLEVHGIMRFDPNEEDSMNYYDYLDVGEFYCGNEDCGVALVMNHRLTKEQTAWIYWIVSLLTPIRRFPLNDEITAIGNSQQLAELTLQLIGNWTVGKTIDDVYSEPEIPAVTFYFQDGAELRLESAVVVEEDRQMARLHAMFKEGTLEEYPDSPCEVYYEMD